MKERFRTCEVFVAINTVVSWPSWTMSQLGVKSELTGLTPPRRSPRRSRRGFEKWHSGGLRCGAPAVVRALQKMCRHCWVLRWKKLKISIPLPIIVFFRPSGHYVNTLHLWHIIMKETVWSNLSWFCWRVEQLRIREGEGVSHDSSA